MKRYACGGTGMSLTMGSATNLVNKKFHKANKLIKTSHLYSHPENELKAKYASICYMLHRER